ncbi:DMT family transporter [Burkholderia diffusa]|uniref:DMT family transporter n=1 Tax=Burkholderia diffusa TaxID=488732 RepID=UPI000AE38B11|nr:DMT family transporter [Burkholderia diffusa]
MISLTTLLSYLLVVAAGMSVALQQVLNANLRAQLASPWWAGSVSYFVGLVAMLAVAFLPPQPRLARSPEPDRGSAGRADSSARCLSASRS